MELPFKISVLVFVKDAAGRLLMIERRKAPNQGCWSPIGGKLEMAHGESPFECAVREVGEEAGLEITREDLHLWSMISEKHYEGETHWLMFCFECKKPLEALPVTIDEGRFQFYTREEVDGIKLPETDRTMIWPNYDRFKSGFVAISVDCQQSRDMEIVVEESFGM